MCYNTLKDFGEQIFMSNKDKLHSGEIYYPSDENIMKEQLKCLDRLY